MIGCNSVFDLISHDAGSGVEHTHARILQLCIDLALKRFWKIRSTRQFFRKLAISVPKLSKARPAGVRHFSTQVFNERVVNGRMLALRECLSDLGINRVSGCNHEAMHESMRSNHLEQKVLRDAPGLQHRECNGLVLVERKPSSNLRQCALRVGELLTEFCQRLCVDPVYQPDKDVVEEVFLMCRQLSRAAEKQFCCSIKDPGPALDRPTLRRIQIREQLRCCRYHRAPLGLRPGCDGCQARQDQLNSCVPAKTFSNGSRSIGGRYAGGAAK